MSVEIATADVLEWARTYTGPPFHAILCDPPYHLTSGNAVYDLELTGAGNPRQRRPKGSNGGFMGKQWDGGGVAFDPATWAALAEHLHPGGFVMAFASSRGWHRLAVAIEDAGLRIHPSIFGWAFGSGFPKATRIDTQIDKAAGAERERECVGSDGAHRRPRAMAPGGAERLAVQTVSAPATPLAAAWEGHRYGGQALKPALEPIIVAQKPYAGRPVDSITATGAGALWVDGGRVATGEQDIAEMTGRSGGHSTYGPDDTNVALGHGLGRPLGELWQPSAGRWPPNFVLSHVETCNGVCAPECPVRRLGERSSGAMQGAYMGPVDSVAMNNGLGMAPRNIQASTGTAARFFPNPSWELDIAEAIAAADPVMYAAKASRRERNAGCEGLEERDGADISGGGGTAHPKADAYQARKTARANPHPTVKPLALVRWLATLLLPPDAYAPRRILIPFSGSGSEMIGAMLAGWEDVQGIEGEAEYVEIARARLAWWEANRDKAPAVRAMGDQPELAKQPNGRSAVGPLTTVLPGLNGTRTPAPMLPGLELVP